jgi:hypothetical protein
MLARSGSNWIPHCVGALHVPFVFKSSWYYVRSSTLTTFSAIRSHQAVWWFWAHSRVTAAVHILGGRSSNANVKFERHFIRWLTYVVPFVRDMRCLQRHSGGIFNYALLRPLDWWLSTNDSKERRWLFASWLGVTHQNSRILCIILTKQLLLQSLAFLIFTCTIRFTI